MRSSRSADRRTCKARYCAIFDAHSMIDSRHVLFDDRPFVQVFGDIVRSGADQFHATFVRLVVGSGALKTRQERVMYVDGALSNRRDDSHAIGTRQS